MSGGSTKAVAKPERHSVCVSRWRAAMRSSRVFMVLQNACDGGGAGGVLMMAGGLAGSGRVGASDVGGGGGGSSHAGRVEKGIAFKSRLGI